MEYEPLEDIEPMDRELSPDIQDGKGVRLDYLGRTTSGRIVNLEFQKRGDEDFVKRALFCGSTIIHRQLVSGNDYSTLCQTIFVALLDFSLFKEKDGWYWDFVLTHGKTGKVLTRDLLLMFVEMNKVQKILSSLRRKVKSGSLDSKELTTRLALWGGYVTNKGVDIVSEVMTQDKVFSEVLKAEHDYWGDSRNRFIQMMEEKREYDALSALPSAERKSERQSLQEIKLTVARSILADGLPLEETAQLMSGLLPDLVFLFFARVSGRGKSRRPVPGESPS
jgi:predicted transposase/invertase (TIGR01784 family)